MAIDLRDTALDVCGEVSHGICRWEGPFVAWLHILGDVLVLPAFLSIPIILVVLMWKRPDFRFRRYYLSLCVIFMLAGIAHLANLTTIWWQSYELEGYAKLFNALAACFVALRVAPLARRIADMPTARELALHRKQMREQEKRRQHDHQLRSLGELSAGIAHNFNNAVAAVEAGILLYIKKYCPGCEASEKGNALLLQTVESARRGAAIARHLLAFARMDVLKPEPVDVIKLFRGVQSVLESTLAISVAKGIRVTTAFPSELPPVQADPTQLQVTLINLAMNAKDAMPDGGVIIFKAHEEFISARNEIDHLEHGEYVRLAIEDTGTGMPPEVLARALEPFFTTKPNGKGTGLGLSMAHGFARQSGGTITLKSESGKGTEVSLWLPVSHDLNKNKSNDTTSPAES